MRPVSYWIGQYVLAATTMCALLVAIGLLRGESFDAAWPGALAWATASASIFVGSRYWQARKGSCAMCKDTTKP